MNTLNAQYDALSSASRKKIERACKSDTYALVKLSASGLVDDVRGFDIAADAYRGFANAVSLDASTNVALYMRDSDTFALEMSRIPEITESDAPTEALKLSSTDNYVAIDTRESAPEIQNERTSSKKGTNMGKSNKITESAILSAVASNPKRVSTVVPTSVVHAERVTEIRDHALIASDGSRLHAYVNSAGILTCETKEEYKARRAGIAARKQANASAPVVAQAPVASAPAQTDAIAQALELLRSAGIDVSTLAQSSAPIAQANAKKSAPVVASAPVASAPVKRGHAQNEREIATICKYLAQLNSSRTAFEKANSVDLDSLAVNPLRDIKNALRERVNAQNA